MSEEQYSKVSRRMWSDEKFLALSAPPPNARDLWQYLLTGKRCTSIPGLLAVGVLGLADDLDWPATATGKCLDEIEKAGMAVADRKARLIWLPKALAAHNMPANPSVVTGWAKPWRMLPECPLRNLAADTMLAILAEEDARRSKSKRHPDRQATGLAGAFEVVIGQKTLSESGVRIGRPPRVKSGRPEQGAEHRQEHRVPDRVPHGVEQGAELQDQEQEIGSSLRSDRAGTGETPHAAQDGATLPVADTEAPPSPLPPMRGESDRPVLGTEAPLPGPSAPVTASGTVAPSLDAPRGGSVPGRPHPAAPSHAPGEALALPGMDAPPPSRRGRRPKDGPSVEDRCREAYEAGIRAARPGERFVIAGKAFFSLLGRVVAEHARGSDESKLGGDSLIAWFRDRAEEFGRGVDPEYAGGYQPHAFAKWINARSESVLRLSPDHEWIAERWRTARAKQNIPDAGVTDPKDIIRFWSLCEQAAHGATGDWRPTARQIAAFWIRCYLREKQDRANGIQDRGYPFGWLDADRCNGYGLPRQSDVESGPTVRKAPVYDTEPIEMPDFEKVKAGAAGILALLKGR